MKLLLLFVGIMLLFGSLTRSSIVPCGTKLLVKFYNGKKVVKKEVFNDGNFWITHEGKSLYMEGVPECDSMSIDIYTPVKSKP